MTDALQEGYLSDRLAHLSELVKEASSSEQLYPKQRDIVVEEVSLAIEALQARLD